ncbi:MULTISPECIES: hypothetical protein [Nostoc]|nr:MULTISPECIES: hypothetical protein [Nostoc]
MGHRAWEMGMMEQGRKSYSLPPVPGAFFSCPMPNAQCPNPFM